MDTPFRRFLLSEENQKKYGFTIKVDKGISIYGDCDINTLLDAAYGHPARSEKSVIDSDRLIRVSIIDSGLYVQLPRQSEPVSAVVKILTDDNSEEPNFAICMEQDESILSRLSLVNPAYYPDEDSCSYLMDRSSLTVINDYVNDNHERLLKEWNKIHPNNSIETDLPIPNYRFLASDAHLNRCREEKNK